MTMSAEAIQVDVRRGEPVESSHVVHGVLATATGATHVWGDGNRMTMPRSAIKSIQLLPLLTTGAAEAFEVSDDEIALAAASHSAEPRHVHAVGAWLERIGSDIAELECGPADPINDDAARDVYRSGAIPSAIHNCCSGKHAGFLTVAHHHDGDPAFDLPGYLSPKHGVQRLVTAAQEVLTGVDLAAQTPVVDGCGIPVYRFPLLALAQAMARLVTPGAVPEPFGPAVDRVAAALPSRSYWVSGTGRADHVLTEAAVEPLIIKGGAEGVSMGALPERGLGFAFKCDDGASRGVDEAVAAMLHALGVHEDRVSPNAPLTNKAGTEVGDITVRFTAP